VLSGTQSHYVRDKVISINMTPASIPALQELVKSERILSIRTQIDVEPILKNAVEVQQIPSPTFSEERRATYIKDRFARSALQDIMIDGLNNVYGRWPGTVPDSPALLVSAHTDTVFPPDMDLATRRENERMYGPGLGDNSLGVAALLALLDIFGNHQLHPAADIWFVADSREEGLGDLAGIRAVWDRHGPRLGAAIVVEGMALGHIYHAGIAVRRLRIACCAPGGHSWLHFGQPSAIHGLVNLGARITALTPPSEPRTTYNIGLISGGHSVNSLATCADLYLDLRSEGPASLATLEEQVVGMVDALRRPGLDFTIEVVGDRPSGRIALDHPLVQLASAVLESIGHQPIYDSGSTDANVLLANGLPAVTVGVSFGGHAHRPDEYIEIAPIADGIWQLVLLTLAAANQMHAWGQSESGVTSPDQGPVNQYPSTF
jgi:tripeptide aminopeptidase